MKKYIYIISLFFASLTLQCVFGESAFAQAQKLPTEGVEYKYVLLEKFTATWCVYCPASAIVTRKMLEEGKRIAPISYQMNETGDMAIYYNIEAYQRGFYYDTIRSIPRSFFNGNHFVSGADEDKTLRNFNKVYDTCIADKTPYTLDMDVKYIRNVEARRDSFVVNLTIEKVAEHSGKDLYLHLVVTENNIPKIWRGETKVDHAQRLMYPSEKGQLLDFSQGNTIKKTISFSMGSGYQFFRRNADLIAFIQDNSYTEIDGINKQSRKVMQTDMWQMQKDTQYFSADFNQYESLILIGDTIQYFDNSLGNPTKRTWTFEGGTPASSTELNPKVSYAQTGIYAATLSIEKDGKTATYTWDNAIEVIDFKASFESNYTKVAPATPVQFKNTSTGEADSCFWTFGGGSPLVSTEVNPTVTYAKEGQYPVKLVTTRTSKSGRKFRSETTVLDYITVEEGYISIEEDAKKASLSIYPNPSKNGIFFIENLTPSHTVRVYNITGQEIKNCISNNCINLSRTQKGMYFVKIEKQGEKQDIWINKIIW